MHCSLKKSTVSVLLIVNLLFICNTAFATDISVARNIEDIYTHMKNLFIIGDKTNSFTSAMEVYDQNPQLRTYADAEKYYRYMTGRTELQSGNLEEASLLFQSLDTFLNSKSYFAYAKGRIAENERRYEDAVSFYITASDVAELDAVERMRRCNSLIGEEIKAEKYSDAVKQYEEAVRLQDADKIAELLQVFLSLQDYNNSNTYISLCEEWIRDAERELKISAREDGSTIEVSWIDSEENRTYNLTYRPVNNDSVIIIENCSTPHILSNLIPNTEYEITLIDNENSNVKTAITVSTLESAKYSDKILKFSKLDLAGIQNDDTILELLLPSEVFNDYPAFVCRRENNSFGQSDLLNYSLFCNIIYKNLTSEELPININLVLRSTTGGTYISENLSYLLPADDNSNMICICLEDAIPIIKERGFVNDQYTLEVYIDELLFCKGFFYIN